MKKYILLLFLLPVMAFGQLKNKSRKFDDYTVRYTYSDTSYSVIWESFGKRIYYSAIIAVYKNGEKVGDSFTGLYCPDGDGKKDDPQQWINKVKNPVQ